MAFPKQNHWIFIAFDLNSPLARQTSEKKACKPGLDSVFSRVVLPESLAVCTKNFKNFWNWGAVYLIEKTLLNENLKVLHENYSLFEASFIFGLKRSLGKRGGGYSKKNWVGECGLLPKTLILFMTKICDFPYHMAWKSCYLWPKSPKSIPYLWLKRLTSLLFGAAHTYIAHVREYLLGSEVANNRRPGNFSGN